MKYNFFALSSWINLDVLPVDGDTSGIEITDSTESYWRHVYCSPSATGATVDNGHVDRPALIFSEREHFRTSEFMEKDIQDTRILLPQGFDASY
jgi:hypothetical protein